MRKRVAHGWAMFPTAIGDCGVAWSAQGLTGVMLPAATAQGTRAHLRAHAGPAAAEQPLLAAEDAQVQGAAGGGPASDAPRVPAFVRDAVQAMQRLLAGRPCELAHLRLDWRGIEGFERRVYEAALKLGPGQTCTYGELAAAIELPDAARAVGAALGRNPWPLIVPCHRVTAAGGRLGGFSSPGGAQTKQQLLVIEAAMRRREGELF